MKFEHAKTALKDAAAAMDRARELLCREYVVSRRLTETRGDLVARVGYYGNFDDAKVGITYIQFRDWGTASLCDLDAIELSSLAVLQAQLERWMAGHRDDLPTQEELDSYGKL